MPHKKSKLALSLALLAGLALASWACARLTGSQAATPTPDPYLFTPVTTPLKLEPATLPDAQTGEEYEVEIQISGNVTPISNISISQGKLPAGLKLVFANQVDGIRISGVPTETGSFTFSLLVSCFGTMVSGQSTVVEYTLVVQ